MINDFVICPYCQHEQSDCTNGGNPGPWWNGEDDSFEVICGSCKQKFVLDTYWYPRFETFKVMNRDGN